MFIPISFKKVIRDWKKSSISKFAGINNGTRCNFIQLLSHLFELGICIKLVKIVFVSPGICIKLIEAIEMKRLYENFYL